MHDAIKVIISQRLKDADIDHRTYHALEEAYCAGEMQGIITAQNNPVKKEQ